MLAPAGFAQSRRWFAVVGKRYKCTRWGVFGAGRKTSPAKPMKQNQGEHDGRRTENDRPGFAKSSAAAQRSAGEDPPPYPPNTPSSLDITKQPPELHSDSFLVSSAGGLPWRDQNATLNNLIQQAFSTAKGPRKNLFVMTWRMYPNANNPPPPGSACGCGCSCSC
jgi:hypothetical protein